MTELSRRDKRLMNRVIQFIQDKPQGAGTWEDESEVPLPGRGKITLCIMDKVGGDSAERVIRVFQRTYLCFDLVYSHHTHELIRVNPPKAR